MAAVFGNVGADSAEVNDFHINSDVDKSTIAQHHTLGIQANQAAPGDHNHDGKNTRKVDPANLLETIQEYEVEGGTSGTQPTFNGDPLFTGEYTKIGPIVHFNIQVDFNNITDFGTGQYYLKLPFPARRAYMLRDGCLHDVDTNREYHISGHVDAESSFLYLFTTDLLGQRLHDFPFSQGEPITLTTADNFHIAGVYHASF